MLSLIFIIVLLALLARLFHKWATLNNDFFEKRGIPQMKPTFLVGNNSGALMRKFTVPEFAMHIYSQFPNEKVFGFFDVRTPVYYIRDLELIKQLTIKDFDHFEDHLTFIDDKSDELFGNSLLLMRGEKWRDMRATLSPAFTGSKMRLMFELVSECADDLVGYFMRQAKNGDKINWEMKELFSRHTNDVIASCAFGIKVNSLENSENEFYQIGKQSLDFSRPKAVCKFLLLRIVPFLMKALSIGVVDQNVGKFFRTMVLDTMDVREKENIYRPDMINILMQFRNGNDKSGVEEKTITNDGFATVEESHIGKASVRRQWTDNELVAQCFLFFLAGFETTSTLLTFLTYELVVNRDVQQKLFEEILKTNESLNGKRIHYDALQKMRYMDQVVTETLRKWPPQPILDRVCIKDYSYSNGDNLNLSINKGYAINIPVYGVHHDPKYYPEPEKFDPDRFSDENKSNIVPGSFLPFGVGPRNCIGSRFALMETKAIIYYMVLNFSLEPNQKTQIPIVLKKNPFTLIGEQGVHLELKPRDLN